MIDVWGAENPIEKVDDHYDQFKKLIWPNQQAMRVNSQKLEKPLTALYLVFVRILKQKNFIENYSGLFFKNNAKLNALACEY